MVAIYIETGMLGIYRVHKNKHERQDQTVAIQTDRSGSHLRYEIAGYHIILRSNRKKIIRLEKEQKQYDKKK